MSSHVYGNDKAEDVFGTSEKIPRDRMVCRAVKKVHEQILASAKPRLPLIWSEFNASYMNETAVTDAAYMGPWLADTIRQCDGLVDMMSYWTFSDVFEEQGVVKETFSRRAVAGGRQYSEAGVCGVCAAAYTGRRADRVGLRFPLATRRADGTRVIAVWNYALPDKAGPAKTVTLRFKGGSAMHASISRVDDEHGDVRSTYEKLGSPRYPTLAQIESLRKAAQLASPENRELSNEELTLTLPSHGLAVIEVK